ncbi:MAG TPA: DUF6056 family protein [Bacteroidia bacterium]|jgi:hypothetical protein|nr:DUF6056 family protein [Bacteroidia bacterium]
MSKKYIYGFSGLLSLFVGLIILLCFYFRISTDDYFFIVEIERIGIIKVVTNLYMTWSGRFAAFTVLSTLFKILNPDFFFLVPTGTFILLAIGIYRCFSQLLTYFHFEFNVLTKWMLSLSFLSALFFLSLDIGETWFWCTGNVVYLFCIVALVWGFVFILRQRTTQINNLAIAVCFIYIGGSSEVYSIVFICILAFVLLRNYKSFRSNSLNDLGGSILLFIKESRQQKLLVAFSSLSIAATITILAPGNYLRDQLLPRHQFFFSFFITAKSFVKFFIIYIPLHFHIVIAFFTVFVFVGNEAREKKLLNINYAFLPFTKKITILFVSILAVLFYLIAYIMSETGPARAWFLASFLFTVYCCSISFYAGYCHLFSSKQLNYLKILSLFFTGMLLGYSLISQSVIAKRYAKAYDLREELLFRMKNEKDTVIKVAPLPDPGMLYTAEITGDASHYTNQHLQLVHKLKAKVVKN